MFLSFWFFITFSGNPNPLCFDVFSVPKKEKEKEKKKSRFASCSCSSNKDDADEGPQCDICLDTSCPTVKGPTRARPIQKRDPNFQQPKQCPTTNWEEYPRRIWIRLGSSRRYWFRIRSAWVFPVNKLYFFEKCSFFTWGTMFGAEWLRNHKHRRYWFRIHSAQFFSCEQATFFQKIYLVCSKYLCWLDSKW